MDKDPQQVTDGHPPVVLVGGSHCGDGRQLLEGTVPENCVALGGTQQSTALLDAWEQKVKLKGPKPMIFLE